MLMHICRLPVHGSYLTQKVFMRTNNIQSGVSLQRGTGSNR